MNGSSDRHRGAFIDARGSTVNPGDRVEYQYGARRGILIEALQDGDAEVKFDDTGRHEMVKFVRLCKV